MIEWFLMVLFVQFAMRMAGMPMRLVWWCIGAACATGMGVGAVLLAVHVPMSTAALVWRLVMLTTYAGGFLMWTIRRKGVRR